MRRGAAWPAKWPSSRLVVREHKHGWVSAYGRSAWRPRRSGCRLCCRHRVRVRVRHPVSSVRCERPVSTGACPPDRCPVWRLSVQESSVRPPVSVRCGVRGVRRHEVAGCGGGAGRRTAGMAGVGVVARHVHDGASSAEVGAWRSKLAQAGLGPSGGSAWTWSSSCEVVGSAPGRPGEAGMRARIAHREAAGGDHAAWSLCEAWAWVGWPLRAFGLHCDLRLRPQRGRNL
jgi:hypothetical protein